MVKYPPNIEQYTPLSAHVPPGADIPWQATLRVRIFAFTLLAVAAVGLIYTFAQPAIYQSEATLLTSAQASIDSLGSEADSQHVAIQRQILLGEELLAKTRARLEADPDYDLDAAAFKRQLEVRAVVGTNLVAMTAQGSDAELLPRILNTWIDVYLQARAADIEAISGHTVRLIQEELDQLAARLEQGRADLVAFREANEIISGERSENEALSRLDGLQRALNTALEEEVKARSQEETFREAIARGETVIPGNGQRGLNQKEAKLLRLEKQMAELNETYTREYLELQPTLKAIPEEISALSEEIASLRSVGTRKSWKKPRKTMPRRADRYAISGNSGRNTSSRPRHSVPSFPNTGPASATWKIWSA